MRLFPLAMCILVVFFGLMALAYKAQYDQCEAFNGVLIDGRCIPKERVT